MNQMKNLEMRQLMLLHRFHFSCTLTTINSEGFQQMSLDASAGAIDALEKTGIELKVTDSEHADIDKSCTMTPSILLQLNPVGMGQDYQVEDFLTRKPPAAKPKASL